MKQALLFFILAFLCLSVSAQEIKPMVVTTSGATMDANDINMSFTIGEITIKTISDSINNIGQGFINSATASTAGTFVAKNVFTLYMDTVIGTSGQQVVVHIKVRNFNKILSAQGSIGFDSTALSFVQTEDYGANGFSSANFGTNNASSGKVSFSWTDPTLLGTTLPNDTVFFAIRFNVTAPTGSTVPVKFNTLPTGLEFVDTSYTALGILLEPGLVDIANTVVLSGNVETELGYGVPTVTLTAAGTPAFTQLTDTSGNYSMNLIAGDAYTLTPSKNNDSLVTNGVTTLDYLLIQRYILGNGTLSSPYDIIAADVNSSGSVTSLDVVYVKSFILGTITAFPGNKLWAFVPANYVFPNPLNPFPFPSSLSYTNLTAQSNQNFIGMKLGDVNDSWNPHIEGSLKKDSVYLDVPQLTAAPESEIEIPVTAKNFQNISGMQFTVGWDATKLEFAGIDSLQGALAPAVEFGTTRLNSGELSLFWANPNNAATTVPDGNVLFYIKYKVTGNAGDSSPVKINSDFALVQIVNNDLIVENYAITNGLVKIGNPTAIINVTGVQQPVINVSPNPFSGITRLSFQLFNTTGVNIDIYDELGQKLEQTGANYETGIYVLDLGNSWADGIYFVQLRAGDYLKTIKVIKSSK